MTARFPHRLCAAVLAIALTATACGGDSERPIVPEVNVRTPVSPDLATEDALGETATIDPGTSSTTATTTPPTTAPPPLERVHVAADGDDLQRGEQPNSAVATLARALEVLAPGGTIEFQPGVYPPLEIVGVNSTADAPLRIEANGAVEFASGDYAWGAGVLIQDSSYLELDGLQVRRSLWGIYVQNAHHISLTNNDVADIGQEGIRVKDGSSHVIITGNSVADTGRRTDQGEANGEGIYIGTGSPGGVDLVSNVTISNNTIVRTTDEAIDIKRPSTDVDIVGNTISDVVTQTSGALVVYLNNEDDTDPRITVEANTISNVTRSSPHRDGNCIVAQATVRIANNTLSNCQHRGIYLRGTNGTVTIVDNTITSPGELGAIVDEGLGISIVVENNLDAGGRSLSITAS